MSMFDSIIVSQSLIDKLIEGTDIKLVPLKGYYSFQTKDLDNCLTNFYIEADGSFTWEKQDYAYEKEEADLAEVMSQFKFTPRPIGDPEMITDTRTAYIDFYDFCANDKERLFVTFTAHVKNGKLVEPLVLKSIERTNLEEERIRTNKTREQWQKTQDTWEWKLASFIFEIRWRVQRVFFPLFRKLDALENSLRNKAKERSSLS